MSDPEWLEEAIRLRGRGLTFRSIARELGQPHKTIYWWVRKRTGSGPKRRCKTCGISFPTNQSNQQYCSRDCFNARAEKRTPEATAKMRRVMRRRRGKDNPNYRHGKRCGHRDREAEAVWYAALGPRCEAPDCSRPENFQLVLHHVCYRQRVRAAGGDQWDPRNSMTLCAGCHSSHHRRGDVLPLASLPDSAYEFTCELLGRPAAYEYLRRRYDGSDPRLDALLEREVPGLVCRP